MTPAMALGGRDHIWLIGGLSDTAEKRKPPEPGSR
jgi:hypothetical protein